MTSPISANELRRLLHYDPETGVFTWLKRPSNRVHIGDRAGCVHRFGRRKISVLGREYPAAQLAWLYMTGEWPSVEVDHQDTDAGNDAWNNLRLATRRQNMANTKPHRDNKSGLKGVYWSQERRKWAAHITIDYRNYGLGRFDCPAAAHFAYVIAADKAFGTFSRAA